MSNWVRIHVGVGGCGGALAVVVLGQRWRKLYSCLLLKKTPKGRHGDGKTSGESADKRVSEQRFQPRSRVAAAPPHFFCQFH